MKCIRNKKTMIIVRVPDTVAQTMVNTYLNTLTRSGETMGLKARTTGRLENWQYSKTNNIIYGEIYDDVRGRWVDGTPIHTSNIPNGRRGVDFKEGEIIYTLNSTYLLGKEDE